MYLMGGGDIWTVGQTDRRTDGPDFLYGDKKIDIITTFILIFPKTILALLSLPHLMQQPSNKTFKEVLSILFNLGQIQGPENQQKSRIIKAVETLLQVVKAYKIYTGCLPKYTCLPAQSCPILH